MATERRDRADALARGRAPRGPSAVDAAATAVAAPAQPAAKGVAGDGPHPSPCGRASVVRAFDGRQGSVCSPRLWEGGPDATTPKGLRGSGGGGAGALPWAAAGGWKSPPGRGQLQGYQMLLVVTIMGLTRDDLYALSVICSSSDSLIYTARPKTRELAL